MTALRFPTGGHIRYPRPPFGGWREGCGQTQAWSVLTTHGIFGPCALSSRTFTVVAYGNWPLLDSAGLFTCYRSQLPCICVLKRAGELSECPSPAPSRGRRVRRGESRWSRRGGKLRCLTCAGVPTCPLHILTLC